MLPEDEGESAYNIWPRVEALKLCCSSPKYCYGNDDFNSAAGHETIEFDDNDIQDPVEPKPERIELVMDEL